MSKKQTVLYIVVPCYNEEEVFPETTRRLGEKLRALTESNIVSEKSRVLYVDDGSKDKTWQLIAAQHREDPRFLGVKLSRNRGHQNALLCGLMTAKDLCDCAVSMDADLQDDIDALDRFLAEYHDGADIVYGVRSARKTDTVFKRNTAQTFYKIMAMLGAEVVYNHADYRLMSRRALEALAQFPESNLFLRGMVTLIGFPTATVEYERADRFAGESKYPLKKMLSFAMDGIVSFSVKPLRLITLTGALFCAIGLLALLYALVSLLTGRVVAGWTSIIMSIWLVGGVTILALGVIGEYIGRIYAEVKQRPRFLVDTFLSDEE